MNNQFNDGGPAFPVPGNCTDKPEVSAYGMAGDPGMSLRDWFAGYALAGAIASHANPNATGFPQPAITAKDAYEFADAMLAARNKEPLK